MPEVWYPGAVQNPGAFAGYERGRTTMTCVKCHYTVGRNSTGIGLQGYFQWLVSRDGAVQQFAPADALNWDSGEWNGTGPGIEIEYHPDYDDAIFTDAARQATAALVAWLGTEWGIPLTYYNGPRIPRSDGYQGFIAHGSLIQSEQHYDYWPDEDWAAMTTSPAPVPVPAPPAPRPVEENTLHALVTKSSNGALYEVTENGRRYIGSPVDLAALKAAYEAAKAPLPEFAASDDYLARFDVIGRDFGG